MLIKVRFYDWDADFAFRPPLKDAIINTEQIIDVREGVCNRCGPIIKVWLTEKRYMSCDGNIEDFLEKI